MNREDIFSHPAFLDMLDLFLNKEPEVKKTSPITITDIAIKRELERRVAEIQAKRKERKAHEIEQEWEAGL